MLNSKIETNRAQDQRQGILFALAAVMIWSGFIVVSRKAGTSTLLPNDTMFLRYATCATLLFPVWLFRYRFNLFEPRFLLITLVGGLIYAACVFRGFSLTPAGHAAVLLPGSMPMMIAVCSALTRTETIRRSQWLAIGLILAGLALLLKTPHLNEGYAWLLAASLAWSLYSVSIKRLGISPWQGTISMALLTCLVYVPVYMVLPKNLFNADWNDIVLQMVYQGFLATVVQMLLFVQAVRLLGPARVGIFMGLVPIFAGLLAVALLHEPFSPELGLALVLVTAGAWTAHSGRPIPTRFFNSQTKSGV